MVKGTDNRIEFSQASMNEIVQQYLDNHIIGKVKVSTVFYDESTDRYVAWVHEVKEKR